MKYKELGLDPEGGHRPAPASSRPSSRPSCRTRSGTRHGVKVINTLTGFKWIARQDRAATRSGSGPPWARAWTTTTRRSRSARSCSMKHSTFFVFGTEESYGYLPNDYVRDKDGNAACLMFAELCAWVAGQGITGPGVPRPGLPQVRVLPRGHDQHLLRGRERQREDQAHPRHLPQREAEGVRRRAASPSSRTSGARRSSTPTARRSRSRTSTSSRSPTATASRRAGAAPSRR